MFDLTSLGLFDTEYSYEEFFENLKAINQMKAKTIVFTDLYDHTYSFCDPVEPAKLKEFQKAFEYKIPESYLEFLQLTDGLGLLGGVRLYGVDEVVETIKAFHFHQNIIIIGHVMSGACICIDLAAKDNLHMYVYEIMASQEVIYSLNCGFKEFLLRFVKAYGEPFWTWGANWERTVSIEPEDDDEDEPTSFVYHMFTAVDREE